MAKDGRILNFVGLAIPLWGLYPAVCGGDSAGLHPDDGDKTRRTAMEGKLLQDIVKRVLAVSNPDRIILFGSQATGQAARDSDIDLLILQREVENAHDASVSIRAALNGMGKAFDVIVMRTERFEETKNVIGGIAYPANKYGKVVYEAA